MRVGTIANCLVIITTLPSIAAAGTVYVNNVGGNDRMNGRAATIVSRVDGPVATIGQALAVADPTDTIVVTNTGVAYHESVAFDRPGLAWSERHPLVIEGNGATLRGLAALPKDVWRRAGEGTYRYQPFRKGHYQLYVNGQSAVEVAADADVAAPPKLEPLQWCAWHGFVYFRTEPNHWIDQYEFEAPAFDVGMSLHNAHNVVIRNLTIEGFRLDGVAITGASRNVRIENIRSRSNGRVGLSVSGISRVEARGLEFSGNRGGERLLLQTGRVVDLPAAAAVPEKPLP